MKKNLILFVYVSILSVISFAKEKVSTEKYEKPIIRFLPAMQMCRESTTTQTFLVSGKVVVDYEVNDKAELQRLKINEEKTTLKDLNLQKCVIDTMKKIKFPKAPNGKTVKISYPIIFK